ncbi:MAG TPA: nucleoside-diphosphate kinase [Ktedonobacterales bacterium]|nr:nucleoside-diphosphate kinase [Ktedonobacterales bacterium]
MERTLIIVKPDGVERGLIGEVLRRFEQRGLTVAGLKMIRISPELAARHYAEHQGKPFYPGLIQFITSGPVVVGAIQGPGAIALVRAMMGATNPANAVSGTIRGDYAISMSFNVIHGSDGPESAQREIALYFTPDELFGYQRPAEKWISGE